MRAPGTDLLKGGARAQQTANCPPSEHLEHSKLQTALIWNIWSTTNCKLPTLGTSGQLGHCKLPCLGTSGAQQTAACPPWAHLEDPGLELCLSQSQHSPHTPWVLSRPAVTSGGISLAPLRQDFTLSLAPREFFSLLSQLGIPGNQE